MFRGRISGLWLTFAFFGAACATAPAATTPGSESPSTAPAAAADPAMDNIIRVEVVHDRADGGTSTVYIEPTAGVRTTLGTIAPGERKVFDYRVESAIRNIRLIALNASGQTMTSTPITVPRGAGVTWSLQTNSIRTKR